MGGHVDYSSTVQLNTFDERRRSQNVVSYITYRPIPAGRTRKTGSADRDHDDCRSSFMSTSSVWGESRRSSRQVSSATGSVPVRAQRSVWEEDFPTDEIPHVVSPPPATGMRSRRRGSSFQLAWTRVSPPKSSGRAVSTAAPGAHRRHPTRRWEERRHCATIRRSPVEERRTGAARCR